MRALRGNLVVGQSGGPTAVINASLAGVVQEALRHEAIDGIYGMRHGIEGLLREELVDLRRQSTETIERLKHTPSAALGSCRHKLSAVDYERALRVLRAHNVRYF
ncbi:MAG: 6-phosphofructokinase, 6-phosphofructokinase, partial [Armatimonadetes bacterium CSP1-3]